MRWFFGIAAGCVVACGASLAQAQNGPPGGFDPDAMFRRLDVNEDGRLTLEEARPGDRRLLEKVFEMAGKPTSGAITREEFRRVAERHRRGESGPPSGRPTPPSDDRRGNGANPPRRDVPPRDPPPRNPPPRNPPPNNESRPESPSGVSRERPQNSSTTPRAERPTERAGGNTRLEGVWRGWVVDGRGENPNAGHVQMELRIEGNRMTAREIGARGRDDGLGDGTFVIANSGRSGNLDATGTSGRHDGVEYLGVFELEGDTLRWCVGNRGRPRPREMASGRGNYLMILRKQ